MYTEPFPREPLQTHFGLTVDRLSNCFEFTWVLYWGLLWGDYERIRRLLQGEFRKTILRRHSIFQVSVWVSLQLLMSVTVTSLPPEQWRWGPPQRLLFWYDKFNCVLTALLCHCLGTSVALTSWLLESCLAFMLVLGKAVLCPGCILFCSAQCAHWPPGIPIIQCPQYVGWISPTPWIFQSAVNKEITPTFGKRPFQVLTPLQAFCVGLTMASEPSRILFLFNMLKVRLLLATDCRRCVHLGCQKSDSVR